MPLSADQAIPEATVTQQANLGTGMLAICICVVLVEEYIY
jgi:hypothetical protein